MKDKVINLLKILFMFVVVIIIFDIKTTQATAGGGGGVSADTSGCNPYNDYCYYSQGLRFSVFEYNSSTQELITHKTLDYAIVTHDISAIPKTSQRVANPLTSLNSIVNITPFVGNMPVSKLYYLHNGVEPNFTATKKLPDFVKKPTRAWHWDTCYTTKGCADFFGSDQPDLFSRILDVVGIKVSGSNLTLKSGVTKEKLVQNIQNFFGVSADELGISDISKIYFTIEPTMAVHTKKGGNKYYYGSAYEMLKFYYDKKGTLPLNDIKDLLTEDLPNSIRIAQIFGELDTNFIEKYGVKQATKLTSSLTLNNMKKKGYGLNIISVGSLFKDCKTYCRYDEIGGTEAYLTCAADYCENSSEVNDSNEKRKCIIESDKCSYQVKHPLSCSSSCPSSEKNTNCTETSRLNSSTVQMNDIKTCKLYEEGLKNYAGEKEYYIGVNCTEKNSVTYPNTLPDVLDKVGGGFNYSLKVAGNNTCTFEFNVKKYNFERAALLNSERENSNLEPNKAKYKFENLTNINGYDIAKYSTDIRATMKVGSKTENLEVDTSKTSTNLEYFKTISDNKKESKFNGETTLVLKPKCYSLVTGNIVTPELGDNCSDIDADLFSTNMFGYFTYDLEAGRTTTKIDIDKKRLDNSTWCNLGSESCYFDIDDSDNDAECYLTVLNSSGNEATPVGGYYNTKVRVKYNAYLNKVDDADYYFNGVWHNSLGDNWELVPLTNYYNVPAVGATPIDKTISGAIKYRDTNGNEVIKSCPVRIKLKPDPVVITGERCKQMFKPVEYAAIRNYCITEDKWDEDLDIYMSAEDCYKKCSIRNRPTCKMTCNKNDMTCVKNYCSNASNLAFDGYKESGDCIQDCGGFTDDGNSEYIYRPIALGLVDGKTPMAGSNNAFRAFPNRQAGTNWIGYEEKYTSKTAQEIFRESEPIYTIVINKDNIETIENYVNNNKNKYISYDDYTKETTGYYKSTFIKTHNEIFTKVCSNVKGCSNV